MTEFKTTECWYCKQSYPSIEVHLCQLKAQHDENRARAEWISRANTKEKQPHKLVVTEELAALFIYQYSTKAPLPQILYNDEVKAALQAAFDKVNEDASDTRAGHEAELDILVEQILFSKDLSKLQEVTRMNYPDHIADADKMVEYSKGWTLYSDEIRGEPEPEKKPTLYQYTCREYLREMDILTSHEIIKIISKYLERHQTKEGQK